MELIIHLPWPPSVNSLYATYKGRRIKSKRGRDYVKLVAAVVAHLKHDQISVPIEIDLLMHAPTNRKYDVSNHLKAYEDALVQCGLILDDHLISYSGIHKGKKLPPDGLLIVKINWP